MQFPLYIPLHPLAPVDIQFKITSFMQFPQYPHTPPCTHTIGIYQFDASAVLARELVESTLEFTALLILALKNNNRLKKCRHTKK